MPNRNIKEKIKSVGTTKWEDMCMDCGEVRYPEVRKNAFNGIGISMGRCKVCRNEEGIIPARDWMYRAGVYEKVI